MLNPCLQCYIGLVQDRRRKSSRLPWNESDLKWTRQRYSGSQAEHSLHGIRLDVANWLNAERIDQTSKNDIKFTMGQMNADAHATAQSKGEGRSFGLFDPALRTEFERVGPDGRICDDAVNFDDRSLGRCGSLTSVACPCVQEQNGAFRDQSTFVLDVGNGQSGQG